MPFSIYSSALKYNKSFVATQRLVSDNQSKFKKKIANKKSIKKFIYEKIPCVFSILKINDCSLYYMNLLIIN